MSLGLESIAAIGVELALAWSDGEESYLSFELLREACPCANCQGEPDALGRVVRPEVTLGPNATKLLKWENVGGYALQLRWGDGHGTGIYSYSYLRGLAQDAGA